MTYVYRVSSKGRCGCRGYSSWQATEAKSKAEVIRRRKTADNRVEVLTKEQALAMVERNPNVKVYW